MRFSIIVPAHNSATFISNALRTVRMQTFKDYELIVVCDACSDDTEYVARAYTDRVLIVDHGNDGLARQAGLDVAQGDWVLFMDDDDEFRDADVLRDIDAELTDDIDVLCFGFVFGDRGPVRALRRINNAVILWPAVWNKCYRRDFIKDLRFRGIPVERESAPDKDWTERLIRMHPRYSSLEEPLYIYHYMRPGSQTSKLNGGEP